MINELQFIEIYSKTFYDEEYVAELSLTNTNIIIGYASENGTFNIDMNNITENAYKELLNNYNLVLDIIKALKN